MELIDAHCHLESEELLPQLDEHLQQARQAGIVHLITNAVAPEQWATSRQIAARYPEVAFAWGIHPWFVQETHRGQLERLTTAKDQGAAAIGEIGLDAKIESPAMPLQLELFKAQVAVAQELGLPIVIHCRGAFNELLGVLKRFGPLPAGGLVHAFSGSAEVADACIPYGLRFSMGASLTYKPSKKRLRVLERIYPEHLLLETDSPDMPPVHAPEKPNVPANLRHNLHGAAALLGVPEEEIAAHTTRNARVLFAL